MKSHVEELEAEVEKHREMEWLLRSPRGKGLLKEYGLRRSFHLTQQRRSETRADYPIALFTGFRRPAGTLQCNAGTLQVLHYYQEGTDPHEKLRKLSERLGSMLELRVAHAVHRPKAT